MRIDPKNNVNGVYDTSFNKNSKVADNSVSKENKKNIDRVEISPAASKYDQISSIKDKIISEVERGTSPEKLRQLKVQIENGTYHVSSEDIAKAIVNGKVEQDTENE